ncbi:MAG: hypothetical protein IT370_06405 [Deltaproteobacteria bacterium]|nr:hypothetical protein [Deltaproteobacteria bacterium]
MRKPWVAVLCLVLGSCGGTDGPGAAPQPGDDAGPGAVADAAASGDASADTGTPTTPCQLGARSCADSGHERSCRDVAGTPTWVDAACAEYSYCLTDRCVAACLDECALGDTRSTGAGQQTCRLLSSSGGLVSPGSGSHDLARKHLAWLRAHQLANGYIANTVFSDASHRTPIAYTGTVDAAEWTGLYLAAESLRALTTHSPDAIRNVEALVERIHQLFEITATPGYMARFWAPRSGDPLLAALYDPSTTQEKHIATSYRGAPAFYGAWTSIDMYQGVSLGLGLAYQVTASPSHRAMLRELVVTLVRDSSSCAPRCPSGSATSCWARGSAPTSRSMCSTPSWCLARWSTAVSSSRSVPMPTPTTSAPPSCAACASSSPTSPPCYASCPWSGRRCPRSPGREPPSCWHT